MLILLFYLKYWILIAIFAASAIFLIFKTALYEFVAGEIFSYVTIIAALIFCTVEIVALIFILLSSSEKKIDEEKRYLRSKENGYNSLKYYLFIYSFILILLFNEKLFAKLTHSLFSLAMKAFL